MLRISDLADQRLPLLPETLAQLAELIGRRQIRNSTLQEVILKDPAAALAVLRRLAELQPQAAPEVVDLAHALSLIGPAGFKALLAGLSSFAAAEANRASAIRAHYAQAAQAANYARAWGRRKGWANLDGLAMTALLQSPAALVLSIADPVAATRAANAVRSGAPWPAAYAEPLGMEPRAVSLELAHRWGLPRRIAAAIGADASATPAARLAALAADIGRIRLLGWPREESTQLVAALADALELTEAGAWSAMHGQAVAAARELAPLHYPVAAFELLLLPGGQPAKTAQPLATSREGPRSDTRPKAATRKAVRRTAQVAMAGTMREMLELTGVSRVVFFQLTRDRRHLRARLALGVLQDDPLRELAVPLATRHLFERLLASPQSVWCNADNAATYHPHLPRELIEAELNGEFFAVSLVVGQKTVGILFGDGRKLSAEGYQRFRQLCQQAVQALSASRQAA